MMMMMMTATMTTSNDAVKSVLVLPCCTLVYHVAKLTI